MTRLQLGEVGVAATWSTKVSFKGGRYITEDVWVFNNIVLFKSSSVPEVYTIPPWIIDQSRLDFTGLVPSPVQLGASMKTLERLGYYSLESTGSAGEGTAWIPSTAMQNRGVDWDIWMGDKLTHVTITEPQIRTADGARVGMTVSELKTIYGSRIRLETKHQLHLGNWYSAVVQSGGNELTFLTDNEDGMARRPLVDSDVITSITAKKYSKAIPYRPRGSGSRSGSTLGQHNILPGEICPEAVLLHLDVLQDQVWW